MTATTMATRAAGIIHDVDVADVAPLPFDTAAGAAAAGAAVAGAAAGGAAAAFSAAGDFFGVAAFLEAGLGDAAFRDAGDADGAAGDLDGAGLVARFGGMDADPVAPSLT